MTLQFLLCLFLPCCQHCPSPRGTADAGPGQPSVIQLICRKADLDLPPLRCLSQLFLAQHLGKICGFSFPEAVGAVC